MNLPIHLGAAFGTFTEVKQKIQEYEDANFIALYLRDSKPLKNYKRSNPMRFGNINSELKYGYLMYRCKRGGKKFVSRSTGIRNKSSNRLIDCPMYIKLTLNDDGYLQVVAMNERHNHDINQDEYLMNPKKRRLDEHERNEVKQLLKSGVKSSLVREYIKRKTGKTVFSRDICNMMMKEKKKDGVQEETTVEFESLLKNTKLVTNVQIKNIIEATDPLQEVPEQNLKLELPIELQEDYADNHDLNSSNEIADLNDTVIISNFSNNLLKVPNKATAFCTYLASELENLPSQQCDMLIEHITLKLFEVKRRIRQ